MNEGLTKALHLTRIAALAIEEDHAEINQDDHEADPREAYERLRLARKARRDAVVAYLTFLRDSKKPVPST
jgi:hypothetical protein